MALIESGLVEAFNQELRKRRQRRWHAKGDAMTLEWWKSHPRVCFSTLIAAGTVILLVVHFVSEIPVLKPLAEALVVSGILGLTVDTYLKRLLLRDAAAIFIGWALPQEVRDRIRQVSETSIVRKNYRINYKLTVKDNSVVADITHWVDVYNFSVGIQSYASSLSADLVDNPDESAINGEITHNGVIQSWNQGKLIGKKCVKKSEHSISWSLPNVKLQPQDVSDPTISPACMTKWQCRLTMPIEHTDFISFVTPTIGVKITVDCPPQLDFDCDADSSTVHASGSSDWQYNRLYMPGETIRFRWKPCPSKPPRDTSASSQQSPSAP